MASETVTFSELGATGAIQFGDGYRTKASELGQPGYPILRVAQVTDGRIDHANPRDWVRIEFGARMKGKISSVGDIVLTTKGTFGRRAIIDADSEGWVYSPQVCYIRVLDASRVDAGYLYSWLGSEDFLNQARSRTSQTDMADYLSLRDLGAIELRLPLIADQRRIARILGTFGDKIAINRRMSQTLEAMARALFKSWFVDFDPVRAKAEGRDSGLPKHIVDLFPDRLVDSKLGRIPAGWEMGCVDDEFEVTMGQSPPGKSYNVAREGLPFYQGRTDFGSRFPTRRVYCTAPTRLARSGDTLISVRAPVGDINMATEDCAIGRGVAAARHRGGSRSYTYHFMRGLDEVFGRFEAEGTIFGSIGKKDFHAIPCVRPPREVIAEFEVMVAPFDRRVDAAEHEMRSHTALHDALLPKLIS